MVHPHTVNKQKTELDTTNDMSGRVWRLTDPHFSPHLRKEYPPNTNTVGTSALFLLEWKKWAWHLKGTALTNNLLKYNHMSDFSTVNVNWHTKERVFKYAKNQKSSFWALMRLVSPNSDGFVTKTCWLYRHIQHKWLWCFVTNLMTGGILGIL